MVHRRVTQYYSDLAEEYLQLTLYKDAEAVATRALTISPFLIRARLKRGIARKELGMFVAAIADFEIILHHRQKHPDVLKHLDELTSSNISLAEASRISSIVIRLIAKNKDATKESTPEVEVEAQGKTTEHSTSELDDGDLGREVAAYMEPTRHRSDAPPELNASDCRGTRSSGSGTATACRFYNHQGCNRGMKCAFSHAPDIKSVRDSNGKNVCLYYLIGKCKWNADTCIYLHSKDALGNLSPSPPATPPSPPPSQVPESGSDSSPARDSSTEWWNDPVRINQVLEHVLARDARRKQEHEDKETMRLIGDLPAESQDKSKKRKGKGKGKKKERKGPANGPSSQLVFNWDSDSELDLDSSAEFDLAGELAVLEGLQIDEETGYFRDVELMSYGIKPWEFEEAESVLRVLRNF